MAKRPAGAGEADRPRAWSAVTRPAHGERVFQARQFANWACGAACFRDAQHHGTAAKAAGRLTPRLHRAAPHTAGTVWLARARHHVATPHAIAVAGEARIALPAERAIRRHPARPGGAERLPSPGEDEARERGGRDPVRWWSAQRQVEDDVGMLIRSGTGVRLSPRQVKARATTACGDRLNGDAVAPAWAARASLR